MFLEGSCHCGQVRFRLEAPHPYPFNLCYCSICRKTAGGGGYAINLGGRADTLEIEGAEHLSVYQVVLTDPQTGDATTSPAERRFCKHCGSHLWAWDPRWPDLVHPLASAIDSELPKPPERTHLMLGSKAGWVEVAQGDADKVFDAYPDESLAAWHQRLGLGSE